MRWTVLTGDLIASSALAPERVDAVMAELADLARRIADWPPGGAAHFARRAGDGWQMALSHPGIGPRAALFLLAALRSGEAGVATRITIAEGAGSLPESGDLNAAHGAAFTASGRLLDDVPARQVLSCATPGAPRAAVLLAAHIAEGWTQAQARALVLMLPPGAGPRRVAAEALGISRQAVDQALAAAGFAALDAALTELEAQV
jgi:hypothetical protein